MPKAQAIQINWQFMGSAGIMQVEHTANCFGGAWFKSPLSTEVWHPRHIWRETAFQFAEVLALNGETYVVSVNESSVMCRMGCSVAYDRVIFDKVTAQVMNLLVEVDGLLLEKRFTIITCGPKWLKFTTINHWHLWQFLAKRGRPTALPYLSHTWYGSCRAVRTDGVAHTDDRPLHMPWQILSYPVLCFSQLVLLCSTCVVINIMHMHETFHFFLFQKFIIFTLHVDCLSLMKIYSMHELFFPSCGFSSVTGTYKYNIQRHAFMVYSRGHVGNVIYPCAYDPEFKTRLGARCRNPSFDCFVADCVIGRLVVVCVCVWMWL